MAENILLNAKCQRPGVCNAAESLLVHTAIAQPFLERAGRALRQRGVELRGCELTQVLLEAAGVEVKPVTEEDYAAEFLDLILSIKVGDNLDEAVAHIARYGAGHDEAILTHGL